MSEIELPATTFRSICTQLGYRRRKVRVKATESVTLTDLNWSGGTRNTYHAMDIESGQIVTASQLSRPHPMHNEAEGARVALAPGRAIIRTGTFLGKEAMMIIYVHPSNMPALLT
jgi:diaminopimelate decarboxylase